MVSPIFLSATLWLHMLKPRNRFLPVNPTQKSCGGFLYFAGEGAGAAMVHVHAIEDDGTNSTRLEWIKEGHTAIKRRTGQR